VGCFGDGGQFLGSRACLATANRPITPGASVHARTALTYTSEVKLPSLTLAAVPGSALIRPACCSAISQDAWSSSHL